MSFSRKLVCPHCQAVNRVPADRLGADPRCGRCKDPLFGTHPVELTAASFQQHLAVGEVPLLVDFWAPWCGPCKAMAPAYEQAARALEPGVRVAKLNTDEAQDIAAHYAIRSIPTLILFDQGQELARYSGALPAVAIEQWVNAQLQSRDTRVD